LAVFDRRGVGASQRDAADLSLDAHVADLAAVANACGFKRFDVIGDNDASYVAAAFAVQHPARVRRIALWAPLVGGHDARPQQMREFANLLRVDDAHALDQWAGYAVRDGPETARAAFIDAFRKRISPATAAAYLDWEAGIDISDLLPLVEAPALVLNVRRGGPRSMGVAALMPHARFEPVDAPPAPEAFDAGTLAGHMLRFFDDQP
jgi:pimeloyl-ACP methyl ester carboxylesterase